MSPIDGAKPFSKEVQLARGSRRYHRKVASPKRWQAIMDAKGDRCRICEWVRANPQRALSFGLTLCGLPVTYHHLVNRSQGGSDTEANIVPIGGSGTTGHHGEVQELRPAAMRALAESLEDAEYAFLVEHSGEGVFELAWGIKFEREAA